MPPQDEVFISYAHDTPENAEKVLELSNRLRSEGVDCVLDQYEEAPTEGWPRWMDRKIRDARYVLMICTEVYYNRVMGDEKPGVGLGVKWEGNLVYQHLYNDGALNTRFIPVLLDNTHAKFIPAPIAGATRYSLENPAGYDALYKRLIGQPQAAPKPPLGTIKPLPEKPVKTDVKLLITSPINIELWDQAKWRAVFFMFADGAPPTIGFGFKNGQVGREIFKEWREGYGENDDLELIRLSIVEGPIPGLFDGYTVNIGPNIPEQAKLAKKSGTFGDGNLFMAISRLQRMPKAHQSGHLETFKQLYKQHKTYWLMPATLSEDGSQLDPHPELAIRKGEIFLRHSDEIGQHDIDRVVFPKDAADEALMKNPTGRETSHKWTFGKS
ncbi:toll/interleukin-1 receptor domain-containing protein [Acidovorax sp. LjRoot194]|uniref:toll/interleukin-1 receptor domain-containing protein n=1 Tax=Acidovorax sp. LjRoot194 TaxID=3342280 RepID=UPI003ED0C6E3